MSTNQANANANTTPVKPDEKWTNVQLSVKSNRQIALKVDLSALVDMTLPAFGDAAWYGKQDIKSCNIANIPAQRLKVEGMEDVYLDLRVYTKSNAYEARKIRAEREAEEKANREKLEAVRPEAEKLAAVLGKSVDDVIAMLVAAK